jgi:hypothetical protein
MVAAPFIVPNTRLERRIGRSGLTTYVRSEFAEQNPLWLLPSSGACTNGFGPACVRGVLMTGRAVKRVARIAASLFL